MQFCGLAFPRTPDINFSSCRILQLSIIKCYILMNILKIKCDFSAMQLQGWKFNVCLEGSWDGELRFLPGRTRQKSNFNFCASGEPFGRSRQKQRHYPLPTSDEERSAVCITGDRAYWSFSCVVENLNERCVAWARWLTFNSFLPMTEFSSFTKQCFSISDWIFRHLWNNAFSVIYETMLFRHL